MTRLSIHLRKLFSKICKNHLLLLAFSAFSVYNKEKRKGGTFMRILLGMSGGLDSTYAARVLLREGHEVIGAFLSIHDMTDPTPARESAEALGIRLVEVDCRELFDREVVIPFAADYRSGRTPNPCIICNPTVKFKALLDTMYAEGCDRIATGHYARITEEDGRFAVCLSSDGEKDQSYVLYRLGQDVLSHLLLPLADAYKQNVREEARAEGLLAADRPESMEICFLPPGEHAAYIAARFGEAPEGDFVSEDGRILGRHRGILHYTVGQRKGLGIALGERMFVTRIELETNRVILAPDRDREIRTVEVDRLVFSGVAPRTEGSEEFLVRLRYRAPLIPTTVFFEGERVRIELSVPVRAAAPGQSAVFYRDGRVAFGGIIKEKG